MTRKPHLLLVPLERQGHVAPMMKLANNLVHYRLKVTVVNPVSVHSKLMSSLDENDTSINLVSIPEMELDSGAIDKKEEAETAARFSETQLRNLIQNINEDEPVTHVIVDVAASWALRVANQMGIKASGFVVFGMESFALFLHTFKLIESGIVDHDGNLKEESICLSNDIPPWTSQTLLWRVRCNEKEQKNTFRHIFQKASEEVKSCSIILANSFQQLEPAACKLLPNTLPIGPLLSTNGSQRVAGNIWKENTSCLSWLDQQPTGSVIYVAFGSTLRCSQEQLEELAAGLEITGRPFLWALRPNMTGEKPAKLPQGFVERVARSSKVVEWAPQEAVLEHRSVGCFFSHCGWNSALEGVASGVPLLCWPYAWDHFHNTDNICGTWKVGIEVMEDEKGIVTRDEIKCKIEKLMGDEEMKANALKLKEAAAESIREGGSSFNNLKSFVDQLYRM